MSKDKVNVGTVGHVDSGIHSVKSAIRLVGRVIAIKLLEYPPAGRVCHTRPEQPIPQWRGNGKRRKQR